MKVGEEKEATLVGAFEELKRMAESWGAGRAEIKTDDGTWEYLISVKRLKK